MNKIINFHDVKDSSWFDMAITILKSKYNMVGIDELESYYYEEENMQNACHVTVDDGAKTFYNIIFPVLKRHNIPVTIFVSPSICKDEKNFWFQEIRGYNEIEMKKIISDIINVNIIIIRKYSLGSILKNLEIDVIWKIIKRYQQTFNIKNKQPQNMNLQQLSEVDESELVTVGAHSNTHPVLANENYEKSRKEIVNSLDSLRKILNHEITCFAYPNGIPKLDYGDREIDILRSNNCKIAFSMEPINFTTLHNPLSIPRYGLSYGSKAFVKTKLLLGEYWDKLKNLRGNREYKERMKLEI